jgi:predicted Rossmann fold flavoprotein
MQYDVAVIGGGPAGMMAAGRAAELGARVVLLEKNPTLGKKLLITGGGRCNVTNAEFDKHILLGKFKGNKKFLFSPFSRFTVEQTLDFFTSRNMLIKIEAQKRVFPISNSAQSVWDVLVGYMKQHNVNIMTDSPGDGFEYTNGTITGIRLKSKTIIRATKYIIATGGKSRPKTGSTGEGFQWLKEIGHTIIEPDPALVPVKIQELWFHKLSGLSLQDVKLTAFQNGKKQVSNIGNMLFTHFGVSGPLVLNMSRDISELLKYGEVTLEIDTAPRTDIGTLDKDLLTSLQEHTNKKIKNSIGKFVAPTLAPILLELAHIDPETFVHSIHREERLRITKLLKHLPMTVSGILGPEKAIITSGGVDLSEIDFQTMQSKIAPNLYVIGDVLNIDRPSGGYSLQLCWTTGQVAGTHAAKSSVSSIRI